MFSTSEEFDKEMYVPSVAVTKYLLMPIDIFYNWNVWRDKAK
jgi:hypothetical protein